MESGSSLIIIIITFFFFAIVSFVILHESQSTLTMLTSKLIKAHNGLHELSPKSTQYFLSDVCFTISTTMGSYGK